MFKTSIRHALSLVNTRTIRRGEMKGKDNRNRQKNERSIKMRTTTPQTSLIWLKIRLKIIYLCYGKQIIPVRGKGKHIKLHTYNPKKILIFLFQLTPST